MNQGRAWSEAEGEDPLRNLQPDCASLRFVYGPEGWTLAPRWAAYGPGRLDRMTRRRPRRLDMFKRLIGRLLSLRSTPHSAEEREGAHE